MHDAIRRRVLYAFSALLLLLALSAVNWAYTWLRVDSDTDALADRFTALLLDGMRGYASR